MNLCMSLSIALSVAAFFQVSGSDRIAGKVVNKSGEPVRSAIVHLIKGNVKDTTDQNGSFEIPFASTHIYNKTIKLGSNLSIRKNNLYVHTLDNEYVKIDIFDLQGRSIMTLQNGRMKAGNAHASINTGLTSNLYCLRCQIGRQITQMKITGGSLWTNGEISINCRHDDSFVAGKASEYGNKEEIDMLEITHNEYTVKMHLQ